MAEPLPRQIVVQSPPGFGALTLPHPAVDAGLRTLIDNGYRCGPVEVVIDDGAPLILDMATELPRIEEARRRRRRARVLRPEEHRPELALLPRFTGENAHGAIRLKMTRRPGRQRPPRYDVQLGSKLILKNTCSPFQSATRLLAMRGFVGTIKFARAGAQPETIDMATALARLHTGQPIIGRPKPLNRRSA
jgi:hypothetical protein